MPKVLLNEKNSMTKLKYFLELETEVDFEHSSIASIRASPWAAT
jgi:hypothetical protein